MRMPLRTLEEWEAGRRNRRTLEFLAAYEEIYNPNLKVFESEHF